MRSEPRRLYQVAAVRTDILSLGTSLHVHNPHPATPTMASGGLLPRALPMNSLVYIPPAPWQAEGLDAHPLSPILLLAQVPNLEVRLVALEAEGQELLLELERNQ